MLISFSADPMLSWNLINKSPLFNHKRRTGLLKSKEYDWSLHGKGFRNLQYLSTPMNLQTTTFVRQSNVNPPPEAPLPSGSPSGSTRNWIVGIVLTFILPFFTHKWGPWLLLKSKFDQKIETTEHVVKAIENVAERVDKVIDSITDDLPDSNLKKALEHLDEIAEGVAKSAHAADDIIIKVEEAEDKIESLIHLKNSKENEIPKENKDKDEQEITGQQKSDRKNK